MIPNDGIICGFCGDTLQDQNELIDQGYDQKGNRINTYDNDGLIRETSNVDQFFKKTKSEIVRSGEKLVEQWLNITDKRLRPKQVKGLKYKILRPFEEAIITNRFFYGLQQNPNKLVKFKQDRQFGEWLLQRYGISKLEASKPLNRIFIQKLFSLFYSISSVYELVLQRLAVFMVILNWHLAEEDPSFLNPALLLSSWRQEQIGKAFMHYNIAEKNLFLSLKPTSKANPFYDEFVDKAGDVIEQGEASYQEYIAKLKEEFTKLRRKFLWTSGVQEYDGRYNGFNPIEHEIIHIWTGYQQSLGKPTVIELLGESFTKYWRQWLQDHPNEAKSMEENARIALIPQLGVLSESTPRNVRPLFDRYLAQRKFILTRKLEEIYIAMINENIFKIEGGPQVTGQEQIILRKMYLLDKMTCDYWKDMDELGIAGVEEEVARLKLITQYKEQISIIENQMASTSRLFHWPLTGGFIVRDYGDRIYKLFHYIYRPPNLVKEWLDDKTKETKKEKEYPHRDLTIKMPDDRVIPRVAGDDLISTTPLIKKDLQFIPNVEKNIADMGKITYIKDLKKHVEQLSMTSNGQLNGVKSCQDTNPKKGEWEFIFNDYPNSKQFAELFPQAFEGTYMDTKMQMTHLKKYIISHLRHHILVMSRITTRDQMIQYGFENYISLFDESQFNEAFKGFNMEKDDQLGRVFTNDEIENMVIDGLRRDAKGQAEVIRNLQAIFVTDAVRHLRNVRLRAGKFTKKASKKVGGDMDAGEIFTQFMKILMNEIVNDTAVVNVDFNHKDINQHFQAKSVWQKMENAERKGELEYMIARRGLNIEEAVDAGLADGISAEQGAGTVTDPTEDMDELDHGDDEDDYDDRDLSNI